MYIMFQMFWNGNDFDKCMKMRKHATYQLNSTFSLGGYSHMECQYSSETLKIREIKALSLHTIGKHSIHLRRASVCKFIGRGLVSSAFDYTIQLKLKLKPHIKAHDSHPGLRYERCGSGQINK